MEKIRQPIVTIAGHVDHGKTTILDSIRGTFIAKKEAGGITQKISFTLLPIGLLEERCANLLNKFKISLEIPGFLFIDTPGHAAFSNLRKRGGALADLAILVIDINEGIMPQTVECIEILKNSKIPFIVALNKIDAISGWKKYSSTWQDNMDKQADYVRREFDTKMYRIISALSSHGFDSDLFFRVSDFKKQLALVPCSGKTSEGIEELLMMLCGLSQKFLIGKLKLKDEAKGTILEVKREKSMLYLESIIYDGMLRQGDEIAIASFDDVIISKIRTISEALPLARGFKSAEKVSAAAGIRMQLADSTGVLPGMPFAVTNRNKEKMIAELKKEISESVKLYPEGIIVKADSLGSLEALMVLLERGGIKVNKASIGRINKVDVMNASSNLDANPLYAVVLGFNTGIEEDVSQADVKIITNDVIYKLIEDYEKWRDEKQKEIERKKIDRLPSPCKIHVLRYVFRQSKPAIFGVHIEAGILKQNTRLINSEGREIDKIKAIQQENKSVLEAKKGKDVAISMQDVTFGRQVKEDDFLYSEINEQEFRELKSNKKYLTQDEIKVLQEIADIKRKEKATWGI